MAQDQEQKDQEEQQFEGTVDVEDVGPCKKKVSIEIPEEQVKTAREEEYTNLQKDAELPGFRKGRAPRRLLEKRFGDDISERIKLKLLAEVSESALKDKELDALKDPDIDFKKIELPESGPLKFDFEIEVRPEFELPELKGIPVTKPVEDITDEQVDQELQQLRKYSGTWAPKEDGTVEEGDQVIANAAIHLHAREDEETKQEVETDEDDNQVNPNEAADEKAENIEIFVRKNGFVDEVPVENLDELLTGAKPKDKVKTTVDVPKTHYNEYYRGRKIDLEIEIHDIKYLKPAELNESFLERFGADSEEDLKDKIRESLEARQEQQARMQMTEQIQKYLAENTSFELPTDIVADQANNQLQRQYVSLLQQGLSKEELLEKTEQLKASSEEQAREQLKTFFIMDKIAKQLDVEVTDEEVNGQIAQIAMQQGQRPERMKENLQQRGQLDQLKMQIKDDKSLSQLLEWAKVEQEKPKEKETKAQKDEK